MEVEEEQSQQETRTKIQRLSSDNTEMIRDWNNPSSRIIRVSRASGGKDRHSKVLTSKGLRDRRIRLSVGTAIQFYDLQDRLGFDQPSKAVEWLINAASDSISQLPPLNTTNFHDQTQQHHQDQNQNKNQNQTKSSGCCSSGTSESSLLSLSRTEIRGKARDRARERTTAKEQENPSFTQLLTGGFNNRTWTGSDSFLPQESSLNHQNQNQFSFVPDYNFGITSSDSPVTAINGGGYNGSRGTLQSNSQSLFLNNQRSISSSSSSSSPMDSQSISFFMATPPPLEHHNHQLPASFDGRLYLYYGEGNRSSDDKGKHRR